MICSNKRLFFICYCLMVFRLFLIFHLGNQNGIFYYNVIVSYCLKRVPVNSLVIFQLYLIKICITLRIMQAPSQLSSCNKMSWNELQALISPDLYFLHNLMPIMGYTIQSSSRLHTKLRVEELKTHQSQDRMYLSFILFKVFRTPLDSKIK